MFLSWPESDQQDALGWSAYESRRCRECGTHPDDWNPDVGGRKHAWHAEMRECKGCVETQRLADSPDVREAGRGVHIGLGVGLPMDCPTCKPR